MGSDTCTWGIKGFHKCWSGSLAKRRLPWARRCNKLHSTICIVLLSEFVSRNAWLQHQTYTQTHIHTKTHTPFQTELLRTDGAGSDLRRQSLHFTEESTKTSGALKTSKLDQNLDFLSPSFFLNPYSDFTSQCQ